MKWLGTPHDGPIVRQRENIGAEGKRLGLIGWLACWLVWFGLVWLVGWWGSGLLKKHHSRQKCCSLVFMVFFISPSFLSPTKLEETGP